jgi:large repetitive protein
VRTKQLSISRVAVGSKRITSVAGNMQNAPAETELTKPLVVSALDAEGQPLSDLAITFSVLHGSGSVSANQGSVTRPDGLTPARMMTVNTNADGLAQVWWTLGRESGDATQVVVAKNAAVAETARFTATVASGLPARVVISGASGHQIAETNSEPLDPLTALVVDRSNNPLVGVRLRFFVLQGDAIFTQRSGINGVLGANAKELTILSDKNGIASVRPKLERQSGTVRILVTAMNGDQIAAGPEFFQISVMDQKAGATQFSGVVLDHAGRPLPGVQISISRTNLVVSTNAQGRFQFSGAVPSGKIDLFVDGRSAPAAPDLQYPALHFETTVVNGQVNQLPHPIYLPAINLSQAKIVGGAQDVALTIPGFEGFEMLVRANSVTFPDGSHVGPLVVTTVNADRLPMVPPGISGSFGALAWTIQPTGTRFDPPIQVKIPNTSALHPGRKMDIYQWDHDLAMFVPIGLATVNESGTQLVTDAGSGISKAGWGGGPPPQPPNCGRNPPPACRGASCGCSPDCSILAPPPGAACPAAEVCIPKVLSEGVKCDNNACKQCQSGKCNTKYDETEPPNITAVTMPKPSPESGSLSGAYGYTAYEEQDSRGFNVTWNAAVKPYCQQEGKWKYSLETAEIKARIVIDDSQYNDLTDAVINTIAAARPTSAACRNLRNATYSLKVAASTHYTTNGSAFNPLLNPDVPPNGQHLGVIGSSIATQVWSRRESIAAHELVHFKDYVKSVEQEFTKFIDKIKKLETAIQNGDTLETAKNRIKRRFYEALGSLADAITSDSKDAHIDHPGTFYNAALNALEPTFKKIRDKECQLGCSSSCAVLVVSPTALRFDRQPIDQTSQEQFVTVSNGGASALDVTAIASAVAPFRQTSSGSCATSLPFSLASGASCTLSYEFKPLDANSQSQSISVTPGTGQAVSFSLEGKGVALRIFPTFVDIEQRLNATSPTRTVELSNVSNASINVTSIAALPTGFVRTGGSCGSGQFALGGGSSCTLEIAFAPTTAGDVDQAVAITSDVDGPRLLRLFGRGVARGNLLVSPMVHSFGTQAVNSTGTPLVIELKNDGSAALNVTRTTTLSSPFARTGGSCSTSTPFALAIGATCTIEVGFTPTAVGAASQSIAIGTDADGGGSVVLSGTGM